MSKFGTLECTRGVRLHAKFHLYCQIHHSAVPPLIGRENKKLNASAFKKNQMFLCSFLFLTFSRPRSDGWPHRGHWTYFLHLPLSSVILIDSSTGNPVHVLMLSIQAVRGLPLSDDVKIVTESAPRGLMAMSRSRSVLFKRVT